MLLITDNNFSLVKYHVNQNLNSDVVVLTKYINDIHALQELLLEGIYYNNNGDLCRSIYIILYTGNKILDDSFIQNKNNKTYLVVESTNLYKSLFKNKKATNLNLSVSQYKYLVEPTKNIFTTESFDYFWSEYCVNIFKSNPIRWELELRRLFFIFTDNKNKKLTIKDLDIIYGKVTNAGNEYLNHMFTASSTFYLNKIKKEDLFLLFVRGTNIKSIVHKNIELNNSMALYAYICFKESFYKGFIRLTEGVYLLDFIIKNKLLIDYVYIRNLFKLG